MEFDEELQYVSHAQLEQWRKELIPRMRRVCPEMPDTEFSALIERMVRIRAIDLERAKRDAFTE